ncbi:hypothetical protein [Clostridium autoethanogenum]|uniref:Uncharacterized protein n=1 Tax=Clostridium autoethanogenum DSM 10061 TaxID=1341692 RepID=A0ABM5NZM0_9CLOT|nr:hypothetical protein [Clostridium autoethanogenum]AGY77980.1 hypothetical protein CAETHG_3779 [Clostridium autoethanogenum DSM 10061]ALU38114.1 Hypothetical protein CLAU_3687 [Clostridium autoethanogenum DSM 10061]OVY50878.1 hypothetical protein WX72_02039 [Clostridium autoethanogenum]
MKYIAIINRIKAKKATINNYIHNKFNKIKQFISQNIEDILIFLGLFFILYATFLINYIAFLYILGFILLGIGVFLIKFPKK